MQSRIFLPNDFVEPSETTSESRIEVVFDVVVGSICVGVYLPLSLSEMSFHRLPI